MISSVPLTPVFSASNVLKVVTKYVHNKTFMKPAPQQRWGEKNAAPPAFFFSQLLQTYKNLHY